jgi:hypothetical protein
MINFIHLRRRMDLLWAHGFLKLVRQMRKLIDVPHEHFNGMMNCSAQRRPNRAMRNHKHVRFVLIVIERERPFGPSLASIRSITSASILGSQKRQSVLYVSTLPLVDTGNLVASTVINSYLYSLYLSLLKQETCLLKSTDR